MTDEQLARAAALRVANNYAEPGDIELLRRVGCICLFCTQRAIDREKEQ